MTTKTILYSIALILVLSVPVSGSFMSLEMQGITVSESFMTPEMQGMAKWNPNQISADLMWTEDYENKTYNDTTLENVQEWRDHAPDCDWYKKGSSNMCGMTARYLMLDAETHGLELEEIDIKYRTGVMGGHKMLTFDDKGITYYLVNLNVDDTRITDYQGIDQIVTKMMGNISYSIR